METLRDKGGERRRNRPELLSRGDVFAGEEGHVGEAQVLVGGEHSAGQQVGLAHVVEEAAHVAVETGVDAVEVLRLEEGREW